MIEPLFDQKLISYKTENINIKINKPKYEGIALHNDKLYDGDENTYHTVIQTKDKIIMFYRALKIPDHPHKHIHEFSKQFEYTCYAESTDGINFIKPNLNNETNIIFKNNCSHNFFPFYFKNLLLGIGGTQFNTDGLLLLINDKNNIGSWSITKKLIDGSQLLPGWNHNNHFDSFNIIFYDKNYDHYKIYIRHNDPKKRQVQYTTTTDLKNITEFKKINLINYSDHIYYSNFQMYPESKYYIGFPWCTDHFVSMLNEPTMLMFSTNGHDWKTLDFNIIPEKKSAQTAHGMILDKLNNKMYIYVFDPNKELLETYSYGLNRIQEISCLESGTIKLGPFDLKESQEIFINYKTNSDGFIQIELLDEENNSIIKSEKMIGDEYFKEINWLKWQMYKSIPSNGKYYINVILSNASLFSFTM
jgi:hypothetical protein